MLGRLLYSPFLVQLVVIRRCNLSCGYCNEFDETSDPVATDELKRRIDKVAELGAFGLEFTGGEPMLHPELAELIAYAKTKKQFKKVMLISNAFLFNEEKIEALNKAGLDHLQVSVDGVNPNDVTVKVLKSLRPKLDVLARVAKFEVTLSGVVGSTPAAEVREVMAYAKAKGFKPRVLLVHGEDGGVKLGKEDLQLYQDLRREMGERFTEAGDYRTQLSLGNAAPFKCRAGSRYMYVDEHGIVRWCSQTFEAFGISLAKYTLADLKQQFYTEKSCSDRCTLGCSRTTSKADGWRKQNREPDPQFAHAEPIFRIRRTTAPVQI